MEVTFYFNSHISRYVEDEGGRVFAKSILDPLPFIRLTRNTAYMDAEFTLMGFNARLDSAKLFYGFLELNFKEVLEEGESFQRWIRVIINGDARKLFEAYYTLGLEDSCDLEVVDDSDDLDPSDFAQDED